MFRESLPNVSPVVLFTDQTPRGLSNFQPTLPVIGEGTYGHYKILIAGRFNKMASMDAINPRKGQGSPDNRKSTGHRLDDF